MTKVRTCDFCGVEFQPSRKGQRFCRQEHRYNYHNQRRETVRVNREDVIVAAAILTRMARQAKEGKE